jgi:MFS family permease
MGGFISFGAIYARDLGVGRPGLALALFGAVVSAVRLFGRRIPDRFGARRTLVCSFVTLSVGLATIGLWQAPLGLFVGTFVLAVGQALTYPSAMLLAIETTSASERSAAVGSVGAFVDVALGLGALVVGSIAAGAGYGTAFLAVSGVALCGLFVLAPMRNTRRIPLEEGTS